MIHMSKTYKMSMYKPPLLLLDTLKRSRLGTSRVHVPLCFPELTSPRVLTMEFIGDAVAISDLEGMKKMGIRCETYKNQPHSP